MIFYSQFHSAMPGKTEGVDFRVPVAFCYKNEHALQGF